MLALRFCAATSVLALAAAGCSGLLPACCAATAPNAYNITFSTSVHGGSNVTIQVKRAWAPIGADRFFNLATCHYFDSSVSGPGNDAAFFRVVPGFVVQWGIAGLPAIAAAWENANLANDPVVLSNVRGTIAYAAAMDANGVAVNRTTQVYINYGNNSRLDSMGFTPFGIISEADMAIVDAINAAYGEEPDQDSIYAQGDAYLSANFPGLDYITATSVAF